MKLLKIIVLSLFSLELSAQSFNAAPNLATGNTGIAREGIYNLSTNPAGIASISGVVVGSAYQQHFMMSDLSSQALFVASPLQGNNFLGLHLRQYGVRDASNLWTGGLTFARSFGQNIRTSITANWHNYMVQQYISEHSFSADLGFQYLMDKVTLGAFARNISKAMYSKEIDQRIPQELAIGMVYQLSKEINLSTDFVHDTAGHSEIRSGFEYKFDQRVVMRGGAASNPWQYFAGVGLLIQKLQVDIASSFHPRLGSSPQLALSYAF